MSNKDKKNRYFYLSQSLKKIGKYVGRGKKRSIAKAVVENSTLLNLLDYASLGCDEKVNDWQDAQCQLLIKSKFKKNIIY